MGRILAIDYGSKRCGIAVTDPLKLIASGLTTVNTIDLMTFLKSYFASEPVESIVVGEPKQMNAGPSEIEAEIAGFLEDFKVEYPNVAIERVDERFTSKIAYRSLIDSGLPKNKRRDKGLIDEVSATLILQTFLTKSEF